MLIFLAVTSIWSLVKSKPIKLSQNFKKGHWSAKLPLYFLFSWPDSKINSLPLRAADLKAVKGGESALAMARRRYNTVIELFLREWYFLGMDHEKVQYHLRK